MRNLPIGIQSFEDMRINSNNYVYVDKTEHIYRLITTGKIYFLSRPRRFGKSLLISTLDALFSGHKELFEELWIYDKWDWSKSSPVIRIDWTRIEHFSPDDMEVSMRGFLHDVAEKYGISLTKESSADCFGELIVKLHEKTGQKTVVLIDEYDTPILDTMHGPVTEDIQKFLQNFYKRLKAYDDHLRFIFLTGVSKFAKLSIFSTLNNPNDITMDEKYVTVCGYTQEELEHYFSEHIHGLMEKYTTSRTEILEAIRHWYNGYSWDSKIRVYNPFSTLLLFNTKEFSNYWFVSGMPTFLINQIKQRNDIELVLEPVTVPSDVFDSFDPQHIDNLSLLFQTGYLTVKEKMPSLKGIRYTLGSPNYEVDESLKKYLLCSYSNYPLMEITMLTDNMHRQLANCDADGYAQSIRTMMANIPFNLQIGQEKYYHSLFLLWMFVLGFKIEGEIAMGNGRIDAVLEQNDLIVISELKYHTQTKVESLLRNAMKQIRDRKYYEKYLGMGKKLLLLGLAFSGKDIGCKMEKL